MGVCKTEINTIALLIFRTYFLLFIFFTSLFAFIFVYIRSMDPKNVTILLSKRMKNTPVAYNLWDSAWSWYLAAHSTYTLVYGVPSHFNRKPPLLIHMPIYSVSFATCKLWQIIINCITHRTLIKKKRVHQLSSSVETRNHDLLYAYSDWVKYSGSSEIWQKEQWLV